MAPRSKRFTRQEQAPEKSFGAADERALEERGSPARLRAREAIEAGMNRRMGIVTGADRPGSAVDGSIEIPGLSLSVVEASIEAGTTPARDEDF